ncbi:MAG: transcription antitermination factor NusB, partial [Candidatus Cybelea sp.]
MSARELALRVVRDVFPDSGAPRTAHAAFDYRVRRAGLNERDVAFAAELAYGAIKMRRALDFYLAGRVKTIPAVIHEILRLAIYELVYTRADEHATVFEFVNLAKRFGHRGLANLVNAVLLGFLRDRPAAPQRDAFESEDEYLATRYSLPTWLVRQWRGLFGVRLEEICAAVDEPAKSAIVVNPLRGNAYEAAAALREAGVETAPSPIVADALLLERGRLGKLGGDGRWWPQSESSAMPVDILNPQAGEAVLDVCSGRGNKALQIGGRLQREGTLFC